VSRRELSSRVGSRPPPVSGGSRTAWLRANPPAGHPMPDTSTFGNVLVTRTQVRGTAAAAAMVRRTLRAAARAALAVISIVTPRNRNVRSSPPDLVLENDGVWARPLSLRGARVLPYSVRL
jgi:hypothetical protein